MIRGCGQYSNLEGNCGNLPSVLPAITNLPMLFSQRLTIEIERLFKSSSPLDTSVCNLLFLVNFSATKDFPY